MRRANIPNPDHVDWSAPFRPGENLRIFTPVAVPELPKKDRARLAAMTPGRRAQLDADWFVGQVSEVDTPEYRAMIRERADKEWNDHA